MNGEAKTTKLWRIVGGGDKKPDFKLEEYDFRTEEYKPVSQPEENMRLREVRALMLTLYPDYRIYRKFRTRGREFWGFIPENTLDKKGFIN